MVTFAPDAYGVSPIVRDLFIFSRTRRVSKSAQMYIQALRMNLDFISFEFFLYVLCKKKKSHI